MHSCFDRQSCRYSDSRSTPELCVLYHVSLSVHTERLRMRCQNLPSFKYKNIGSKHDHFWFCSYSVWMYSTLLQNELGVAMVVASTQWYFCSGTEVQSFDLDQKVVRQVWLHRCGQWESHMFCDLRYIHIIFYLNFNRVNFYFRISISTSGASKNI